MGSMKNETKEGKILAFEEYKKKKKKKIFKIYLKIGYILFSSNTRYVIPVVRPARLIKIRWT